MAIELNDVVPWGRSFDEYCRMFALNEADLGKRILGCADGPAGFNAEMTNRGGTVVSVDPLFAFSPDEIRRRIDETFSDILEQTRNNSELFVWSADIPDPDALGTVRRAAMNCFLSDYAEGWRAGRYLAAELPEISKVVDHDDFNIALCSHFLFLYSTQRSGDFHIKSVRTLASLAHEVRIFPLLELSGHHSRHLPKVTAAMQDEGYRVDIETVGYEFQRGGNQMLRIRRPAI